MHLCLCLDQLCCSIGNIGNLFRRRNAEHVHFLVTLPEAMEDVTYCQHQHLQQCGDTLWCSCTMQGLATISKVELLHGLELAAEDPINGVRSVR